MAPDQTSDAPVDRLLTVGELARRTGLTTKAVRHYDRVALLRPAVVDAVTGYRYYDPSQLGPARLVHLLRAVDVPLDDVRVCLAADGDPVAVRATLARHRRRVEARATRLRGDLHTIDHHLQELPVTDPAPPPAETTTTPTTEPTTAQTAPSPDAAEHRRLAVDLFNGTWRLMEADDRTRADDDRMLHMAHASRHHWEQAGTAVHLARGEWLCSRVYAVLERGEPSRHHAQRALDLCQENGIGDWDLAFAHEALARAHAVSGDADAARAATEAALAAAEEVADPEDRALLLADLETVPRQPRFW
ncbi:hypothetical protein GCM10027446_33360 [Angustibacter peucedani]